MLLLLPVMLRNRTRTVTNKQATTQPPSPPPPPPQQQPPAVRGRQGRTSPSFIWSLIQQQKQHHAEVVAPSPTSILDVKQFPLSPAGIPLLAQTQQNQLSTSPRPNQRYDHLHGGGEVVGLAILHPQAGVGCRITTGTPTSKRVLFGSHLQIHVPPTPPPTASCKKTQDSPPIFMQDDEEEEEEMGAASGVGKISTTVTYYNSPRRSAAGLPTSPSTPLQSFLSVCETCGRRLGPERNIYVYRGEKGFCSRGCRQIQMELDGGVEEGEAMEGRRRL